MEIYTNTLKNILYNKFVDGPMALQEFTNQNISEILVALNSKNIFNLTVKTIEHLANEKKYHYQIVLLEILNKKINNNQRIKYLLAEAFFKIKGFKEALFHLNQITTQNFNIEHYKLLANIYYQSQDFIKCLGALKIIEKEEGQDIHKTLMALECHRRLIHIDQSENELHKLHNYNINDLKFSLLKIQIELLKGNFEQSLSSLERILAKNSKDTEFLDLYALVLSKYRKYDKAIEILKKLRDLGTPTLTSIANIHLNKREYKLGFKYLSEASTNTFIENYFISKNFKKWSGDNHTKQYLFIYSGEGVGLGDKIFYFRYVIEIIRRFNNIKIIFCINSDREIHLFQYEEIKVINIKDISFNINLENQNYFSSLTKLAFILTKNDDNKNFSINFLPSSIIKFKMWNDYFLAFRSKKNIGINWKGNVKFKLDVYRSINLKLLEPILQNNLFNFFILNTDLLEKEKLILQKYDNVKIIDSELLLDEKENTFVDTIEIIKNLDLVISTDTALAHISSLLKLKTFLILEHSPFWYWDTDDKDNIYSNKEVKFFKQDAPGNWEFVINKINLELKKII